MKQTKEDAQFLPAPELEPEFNDALVLLRKNEVDGLTVSEFADAAETDMAKATRILQVLEAKGLARLRKAGPTKLYFPVRRAP